MSGAARGANVSVTVNGRRHELLPGTTLDAFLRAQGVDPAFTAVERNREVVPRARRAEIVVQEGDAFEVVHFVGGG